MDWDSFHDNLEGRVSEDLGREFTPSLLEEEMENFYRAIYTTLASGQCHALVAS